MYGGPEPSRAIMDSLFNEGNALTSSVCFVWILRRITGRLPRRPFDRYRRGAHDPAEWLLKLNRCWFASAIIAVRREYGTIRPARGGRHQCHVGGARVMRDQVNRWRLP